MSLEKDVTNIKQIVEQGELFKPATPENLSKRKEDREKNMSDWIRSLPKEKLYAMVSDQLDTWVDGLIGEFYYDEADDVYYDNTGKEVSRESLGDDYQQDNLSMGESVSIVTREWLISLMNSIQQAVMHSAHP